MKQRCKNVDCANNADHNGCVGSKEQQGYDGFDGTVPLLIGRHGSLGCGGFELVFP